MNMKNPIRFRLVREIKMKTIRIIACLVLCLVFFVSSLASCGKMTEETAAPDMTEFEETTAESDRATEEETTVAVTTDKWEVLAPKITIIVERDRSLRLELSATQADEKASKNDLFVKGPDEVVEGVTPLIQQMVYERNKAANDLLHTKIEYVFWDYVWSKQAEQIKLVVQGNAADAPDLFVNMYYDLGKAMLNSTLKDVWSIPDSFFDFETEGWLTAWMENMSFTGDRAYILGSDYFLDLMRSITVLPFNLTLMDEHAEKLAPAIIGESGTLGAGEELSPRFFDLVEEGKWTWDVLGKLCEAIWEDTDGNGADSVRDRLGIIADVHYGVNASSFVYSCGEQLTETYIVEDPSSKYYGKQWIRYPDTSAGLDQIFEAVNSVFEGPGSLGTDFTSEGATPEQPGLAFHHAKFAQGETLFAGVNTLAALEDDVFQQMTDYYSVVPCPKVDAAKSYNTVMDYTGDAGGINVNLGPRKAKVLTAFIQYCTENSPAIREEFMQIVTKYKTTVYNQGTDRMLEIIYNGIIYGRDKMVDDMVMVGGASHEERWHVLLKKDLFCAGGSDYIAAEYRSLLPRKQSILSTVMEKWYRLPKVEE